MQRLNPSDKHWEWQKYVHSMCFVLGLLMTPVLATAKVVGYIIDVNGPPSAFVLERAGQIQPKFLMNLHVGDKIFVTKLKNDPLKGRFRGKEYSITLSLSDGNRSLTLTIQDKPFTVGDSNSSSPNVFSNAWNTVFNWLDKLWIKKYQDEVSAGPRGNGQRKQLSVPLLASNKAVLIEGKRDLHLAWKGGKSPYHVQIYKDKKMVLPKAIKTSNEEITLPPIKFVDGQTYEVVITDKQSPPAKGTFKVVAKISQKLLKTKQTLATEIRDLPPQVKETLLAAWLARQGPQWKLEAYQQVSKIEGYNAALFVRWGLAKRK